MKSHAPAKAILAISLFCIALIMPAAYARAAVRGLPNIPAAALQKNIKIQHFTYQTEKVIHYKANGSKEVLTDFNTVKNFLLDKLDFSIQGLIRNADPDAHEEHYLYEYTTAIPVIYYDNSEQFDKTCITPPVTYGMTLIVTKTGLYTRMAQIKQMQIIEY